VKSLDKAIEVQSEYAKAIDEDYTAEVTKLGALYADLAKEFFRPHEGLTRQTSSAK
jgi:Phasin protein